MDLYVLVNLGILAAPLALSFDRRVAFHRKWVPLAGAVLPVSAVYIAWDILATARGHWWFNETYAGEPVLLGLPAGEVLFFFTVPYACLFIYEVVRAYFPLRMIPKVFPIRSIAFSVAVALLAVALIFRDRGYTMLALLSVAALLALAALLDPAVLRSSHAGLFMLLSYGPFLIANGILTSVPIVGYSPDAIWGARVLSIPVEDFLYNFGMLGFYLIAYRRVVRVLARERVADHER
jgi:lycopene cyclase domain-containing protein